MFYFFDCFCFLSNHSKRLLGSLPESLHHLIYLEIDHLWLLCEEQIHIIQVQWKWEETIKFWCRSMLQLEDRTERQQCGVQKMYRCWKERPSFWGYALRTPNMVRQVIKSYGQKGSWLCVNGTIKAAVNSFHVKVSYTTKRHIPLENTFFKPKKIYLKIDLGNQIILFFLLSQTVSWNIKDPELPKW